MISKDQTSNLSTKLISTLINKFNRLFLKCLLTSLLTNHSIIYLSSNLYSLVSPFKKFTSLTFLRNSQLGSIFVLLLKMRIFLLNLTLEKIPLILLLQDTNLRLLLILIQKSLSNMSRINNLKIHSKCKIMNPILQKFLWVFLLIRIYIHQRKTLNSLYIFCNNQ